MGLKLDRHEAAYDPSEDDIDFFLENPRKQSADEKSLGAAVTESTGNVHDLITARIADETLHLDNDRDTDLEDMLALEDFLEKK